MIGTLWQSYRYQNTPSIYLVVCKQDIWPNYKGYKLLNLENGNEIWGFESDGRMNIAATGSIPLEPFE